MADKVMIALALVHAGVLLSWPAIPIIALGTWWNSNTIAHNFIHRPFFKYRSANVGFGLFLTLLLGIPQTLWRDRHLAHHAGRRPSLRLSRQLMVELSVVALSWMVLAVREPRFLIRVYVPGYLLGLGLCALHGYYEHARGTTSYYGRLYNLIFFNDGYHVEHHARPGLHWSRLPESKAVSARESKWPAPLRWMEAFSLEMLERLVLKSQVLQRFVLANHARVFRRLGPMLSRVDRIAIVGGGLFPRTALILDNLVPAAHITIIDVNTANLERARRLLGTRNVAFVNERYTEREENDYDAVVIPLSFQGDRRAIYERPPAPVTIVHDWIWRKRGDGGIVSFALLKRINVVFR